MQDKPHIALHKVIGASRINKSGQLAYRLLKQKYNSPNMRILADHHRKQLFN